MPIVLWVIEVQPRASNLMPKLHHLFIFLVLLANAASSQSVAIDNSLTLLADKITLTEDSILIAEGNVEAQRGNQLLKASKLIFDDKTEEIFVENVTIFLEGQNTKILGDQGQLGLEMRAGLIQAANILVDEKLKIHDLENITVADASVMPEITSGNLNAPTLMIAERASDFILNS